MNEQERTERERLMTLVAVGALDGEKQDKAVERIVELGRKDLDK